MDAHPQPVIKWAKDGKEIMFHESNVFKYEAIFEERRAQLTIQNISVADNGQYRLIVSAKDEEKSLNFLLRVKGEKITNYSILYLAPSKLSNL